MTSATTSATTSAAYARGVVRGRWRIVAVAAGVVGAVVLTGCSGGGGSDSGSESESGGASASSSPSPGTSSAGTGGSGGSPSAAAGELEGSWLATSEGQAVALVVTGEQAGLFATGGTVCSGRVGEASDRQTIRLTCTQGKDKRGTGTVDSVSSTTLKVTWDGGLGEETYTKAEGGQMPSGLPTAGLGS
ncbi:hypothetical protein [Streptomyces sp. TRM72054]|uniref:hypothetical protein n=1 Tax=Streptomyces sp. TRM72054 TaxID=2870562 RepID=UPI0027E077AB|nr:hypothetical protein [Streptomyces sp. TRM72054]